VNELEILTRRFERERLARKQAEHILEVKALELYDANKALTRLNENLEQNIRQRTEELQKSEARYRNVIDQATDIIYSTDEEGYFTFINPRGSEAFGYSAAEIIGKRYIEFVPEKHRASLFQYYTELKEAERTDDYYEFPIVSKNGKQHWIGQKVNRVANEDGSYHYNAVARDITLRIQAEKELELARSALTKSEVKYRSVLENMDLGLMEVDLNGLITRVYERFCEMTGYQSAELIGKDAISTLVLPGYEDVLRREDQDRVEGKSNVYEVKIRKKNGEEIWVLISGAPFYNEQGDIIGSLGIHYNITDRKNLESSLAIAKEKAVTAQQAEQQFLANMSHEIRTPLNAIIGMTHLLRDSELDDKQRELVDILTNSADLLKGLVADILDISKINAGMAEINYSVFDLREAVMRLISTFQLRAEEKGIELTVRSDIDTDCWIYSDRQWINQIMINLISNAIKFTHEGHVVVTVSRIAIGQDKYQYSFEVQDSGIGIGEGELENIFTAFRQANSRVRKDFGGTGLGLSIASRLVSLMGGKLRAESTLGEGSKFSFSLVLEKATAAIVEPAWSSKELGTGLSNLSILVVEDNLMNQKYISSLLTKWNVNYRIANNGKEAVELFESTVYELIFMDLSMPVLDGHQATKMIRSTEKGKTVPIIALTASTFLSKKELAFSSGMTDFLAKPFIPEELFMMIRKYTSRDKSIVPTASERDEAVQLDRASLHKLYNGETEYATEMTETYLDIIDDEVAAIRAATDSGAPEAVRKQLHKVKPMFSMVGLPQITVACEQLEGQLDSQHTLSAAVIQDVSNLVHEIKIAKPAVIAELERLRSK